MVGIICSFWILLLMMLSCNLCKTLRVIELSHPLPMERVNLLESLGNSVISNERMILLRNSSFATIGLQYEKCQSLDRMFDRFSTVCPILPSISLSFHIYDGVRPFQSRYPIFSSFTTRTMAKRSPPAAVPSPEDLTFHDYVINDPLFPNQWHLWNRENPGYDVNVRPVWKMGIFGKGVTVLIIDDGIRSTHKDIAAAFYANSSYDFNDRKALPMPQLADDRHGTRCAGQIVAQPNGICGVGVAFEAKVAGIRMLSKAIQSGDEAKILSYHLNENHIFSCSWGPFDTGKIMEKPDILNLKSMINGIIRGRFGLGTIYVFATGNGGLKDNCNYDGYANSVFTVAVGAIDEDDASPFYMEECASQLFVTYSSGRKDMQEKRKITTTDVTSDDACTSDHGGTSAAAPLGAGLMALMLSSRPDLTWRDVQGVLISASTAIGPLLQNVTTDGWQKTQSGFMFHHRFGFGKADALKFVTIAESWKLVNEHVVKLLPKIIVDRPIPLKLGRNSKFLSVAIDVSNDETVDSENFISRLEHVTVMLDVTFDGKRHRGELEYYLESPYGTVSQLSHARSVDTSSEAIVGWTFSTVAHWHEQMSGRWIFYVTDVGPRDGRRSSYLRSLSFTFWGEGREPIPSSGRSPDQEKALAEKYEDAYFNHNHNHNREIWQDSNSLEISIKRIVKWPPSFVKTDPGKDHDLFMEESSLDADTGFNRMLFIVGLLFSVFVLGSSLWLLLGKWRRFRRSKRFFTPLL